MWFKVDDKIVDHPKFMRLVQHPDGRSAAGLWLLVGAFSGANQTDGFIQDFALPRFGPDAERDAELLVAFGLFDRAQRGTDEGYVLHDFLDRNPSKAKQLADKAYETRKNALHRDKPLLQAVRARDKERCRYCATPVKFSDHNSSSGGVYDHVSAADGNTLANVVVACRGCNGSKGDRTLSDWGFQLLPPGTSSRQGQRRPMEST